MSDWVFGPRSKFSRVVTRGGLAVGGASAIGAGFVQSPRNPVFADAMESSYLLVGNRLWNIHRSTAQVQKLFLKYADDPASEIWTPANGGLSISDTSPAITGAVLPYVFQVGAVFYMVAMQVGRLRLFSSSDLLTWVAADNGSPMLTPSATTTDWYYTIYNAAVAVVGSTWHLLIEGQAAGGSPAYTAPQLGYSSGTFNAAGGPPINWNTNLSAVPVIPSAGNAWLGYVPGRNALLAIVGDLSTGTWRLRAYTASLANNLALAASWVLAPGFSYAVSGVHITDPTLVFSGTNTSKTWGCLLGYNYAQTDGREASSQIADITTFYDAITAPTTASTGYVQQVGTHEVDALDLGHYGLARLTTDSTGQIAATSAGVAGLAAVVSPAFSSSLAFNASTKYGSITTPAAWQPVRTWEAWLNIPANISGDSVIISDGNAFYWGGRATNEILMGWRAATNAAVFSTTANNLLATAGTWQHLVTTMSVDGSNNVTKTDYVNGVPVATTTNAGGAGVGIKASQLSTPLTLMAYNSGGGSALAASIARLALWSRPLTAAEVRSRYQLGRVIPSGFLDQFNFLEGSGSTITSQNGVVCTLSGSPAWSTSVP